MKTIDGARLQPEICARTSTLERLLARSAHALFVSAFALLPTAQAQVLMALGNGKVFEGNSGTTTILKLPVTMGGTPTSDIHGVANAAAISGTGFHPATPGASCVGSVDFLSFSTAFTIPAGTPPTGLSVNITICGDNTIEPDEQIFVSLTNVTGGGFCTSESCAAIGTITNDDGPPSVSINSISVSEPAIGTRIASFTVSLNHPFTQDVSVHFATRDGTATSACTINQVCGPQDYVPTSGTATIPASTATVTNLTTTIPVTIRSDGIKESDQNFFMDLSAPSPATVTFFNTTGTATIHDTTLTIGAFDLSPDDAVVENGDTSAFDLTWTVPDGENWHDLKSLDFRIGNYGDPVLWVRWDEGSNTFSLCKVGGKNGAQTRAAGGPPPASCGPGGAPGSNTPLITPSAELVLADTTVTGSGPTGPGVALHLVVRFGPEISAQSYPIWLSVTDDFGNVDPFVRAGEITVE